MISAEGHDLARRVKISKRPGSNIEAGRQGVLDSGRAGAG